MNKIDMLEQAAMFALAVDSNRVDSDKTQGSAGLCHTIAAHAEDFCRVHEETIWGDVDWYELSDDWFDKYIAPEIYREGKS